MHQRTNRTNDNRSGRISVLHTDFMFLNGSKAGSLHKDLIHREVNRGLHSQVSGMQELQEMQEIQMAQKEDFFKNPKF